MRPRWRGGSVRDSCPYAPCSWTAHSVPLYLSIFFIFEKMTIEKQSKWWKNKIHEHPNAGINGLQKNPQNINKNGAVKKSIAVILNFLKEEWYEKVTKRDIESAYTTLLWLSEKTLKDMRDEIENPILLRSVAHYLLNGWRDGLTVVEYVAKQALWPMQWDAPQQPPNTFLINNASMKFNSLLAGNDTEAHDGE